VQLLDENDMLIWGGDVRDKDAWSGMPRLSRLFLIYLTHYGIIAYSAAQKLQATTYPFVAFAALQPRRTPFASRPTSSSSPSPTMTVLSRHQGPCTPPGAPTSASKLIDHLTAQLLPRVLPFLERIQNQAREREHERELRAVQERAYEDAAQRDRARIEALMEQDREAARKKEQEKAEQEAREREREQRRQAAEKRMEWRKWTRRVVVGDRLERDYVRVGDGGKPLRIAFRLPGNPRLVRQFSATDTLTNLFAFVDAVLVPSSYAPFEDPVMPPDVDDGVEQGVVDPAVILLAQVAGCPGGADAWWGFKLFNAYPRREIQWDAQTKLGEVDVLKGGAQLVVEPVSEPAAGHNEADGNGSDKEGDGYDTEESE
jgi:FAS-associated factor 2